MKTELFRSAIATFCVALLGCSHKTVEVASFPTVPSPDFVLSDENTHNKFSRTIPPVLRVRSGAVVEVHTKEASDGQLHVDSTSADINNVRFDPIHPLTGRRIPSLVYGACPLIAHSANGLRFSTGE